MAISLSPTLTDVESESGFVLSGTGDGWLAWDRAFENADGDEPAESESESELLPSRDGDGWLA